jgi:hypothetical protein
MARWPAAASTTTRSGFAGCVLRWNHPFILYNTPVHPGALNVTEIKKADR